MNFPIKIAVVTAAVIGAALFVAGPTVAQTDAPQKKADSADASSSLLRVNPSIRSSTVAESPDSQESGPKAEKAANPKK
jgi:hypothetical protein